MKIIEEDFSIIDKMRKEADTLEYKAARKKEMLEYKKSLTLEFQLGLYMGEHIVDKYLPRLMYYGPYIRKTKKNYSYKRRDERGIRILKSEANKFESLSAEAYKIEDRESKEFNERWQVYLNYSHELDVKYLPKTLKCYLDTINVAEDKMIDVKNGIRSALWNCDVCSYEIDLDKIRIIENTEDFVGPGTIVELDLPDEPTKV